MFNNIFIFKCLLLVVLNAIQGQECFDFELAESDFPFDHLADFTADEDIGQNWGLGTLGSGEIGALGGNDFAYKLTLLNPALIYVTTCDAETDVDVEIAIFNSCDSTDWLLYQDDSNLPLYYPDGTSEQYDFQCISGYEENPTYANMLPRLELESGSYYIVVSDRGYSGTVKTYIGYSLLVDSTTTNEDYTEINYHFSEGVFGGEYQDVYSGNGIPLEINDYSISINPNGGDADEAYITSLTTMSGDPLSIGESNIKVNINYPDTPTGVEEVTIGPASVSSIFNSVGIPLLNVDGITIELVDALGPRITNSQPSNNEIGIPVDENIILTFSENIQYNNSEINNENAQNCFRIENVETNENLDFSITNLDDTIFTLNPINNFPDYTYIRLIIFETITDTNNNQFASDTIMFRTEDISPPIINQSLLASTNEFITISFNEGVYSSEQGSGAINTSDFSLIFNSNGGNCTNANLSAITKIDGEELEGGESSAKFFLQLSGSPSGIETFSLSPINSSSIFDFEGNGMLSISSTDNLTLFASAIMETFYLADSNEYLDLTFSIGVYGDENQFQPVSLSDLNLTLNSNGSSVLTGQILSLSNINNNPLLGGEETIRLYLNFNEQPSGVEFIEISPTSNGSLFSISGVPLPVTENSGPINLIDQRPPQVDTNISDGSENIIESEPLRITFSENIYDPETGNLMTSEQLRAYITLRDDASEADIPFLVDYSNPPDLYIIPEQDFDSDQIVYYAFNGLLQDETGNLVDFNFNATFMVRDYLPPTVDSSILALDNSYIDIIFDDGIYGAVEFDGQNFVGISPVDRNDFSVEFEPNGSETNIVNIASITRTDSNFLIGGENEIRVNFEYNGTPNGDETLQLIVQPGVTMYDEIGNQLTDTVTIMNPDTLYDILAPTIDMVSLSVDSFITLMEDRPIMFTFNEKIDSIEFNISSTVLDSINYEYEMASSDSSIEITLKPPFVSYDHISINFSYLKDLAGLSTVDITYTYKTPILGDYDFDNAINYHDLWDLVENWELNNMDYEIGPISGQVPHVIPQLDSKFDIEDGMAFVQMWSWYQKEFGEIIEDSTQVGRILNTKTSKNNYIVYIDSNIVAGQLTFTYDSGIKPLQFLSYPQKNDNLFLEFHKSIEGFSKIEFARHNHQKKDSILFDLNQHSFVKIFYNLESSTKLIERKGMINYKNNLVPEKIKLYPAYPNPFNPSTTLKFDIPFNLDNNIFLEVFDVRGSRVDYLDLGLMSPGTHKVKWDGRRHSSGVYIIKLIIGSSRQTQKLLLIK